MRVWPSRIAATYLEIRVNEDVVRFDITVSDAVRVQAVNSVDELIEDIFGILNGHGAIHVDMTFQAATTVRPLLP